MECAAVLSGLVALVPYPSSSQLLFPPFLSLLLCPPARLPTPCPPLPSPSPADRLVRACAELPKLCEFFHIPFQSGDNDILREMKRGYTHQRYRAIIDNIRRYMPDASVSGDAIVGFPGEGAGIGFRACAGGRGRGLMEAPWRVLSLKGERAGGSTGASW